MSLLHNYDLFPSIRSAFGDTEDKSKTAAEELREKIVAEGNLASVSIFTDELKPNFYGTNVLTHYNHFK